MLSVILASLVRTSNQVCWDPGPPRNTKTTLGWFFHLGACFGSVSNIPPQGFIAKQ